MASEKVIRTHSVDVGYGDKIVLKGISTAIPKGKITVIIGANACGKSTLLKTMARLLVPKRGEVYFKGESVFKLPTKTLAQSLGLLPQSPMVPEGITVFDLVARGRYPHQGFSKRLTSHDKKVVMDALEDMALDAIAHRSVETLSGGQRQRVWIAMALAQDTEVLMLDEPTSYLDIKQQIEILNALKRRNQARRTTIVMVLHDMNLSARYADYMIALKEGMLVDSEEPEKILTAENIKTIFGLESVIVKDPVTGTPMIVPLEQKNSLTHLKDYKHAI